MCSGGLSCVGAGDGGAFARGGLVSTIGWWVGGTVSEWGSLGVVVWTRLCFGWFALSCVRGDFCVSVRGFLVWNAKISPIRIIVICIFISIYTKPPTD